MAIIRCSTDEEGKLVPLTVEFEPGDVIQLEGNQRSESIDVQRSFTLYEMSSYFQRLSMWLNADGNGGTVRGDHPDPKLPPPPPEDGAFTFKPKSGDKAITLTID